MRIANFQSQDGFHVFAASCLPTARMEHRSWDHLRFAVVVMRRRKEWANWTPRSADDRPPVPSQKGLYALAPNLIEALRQMHSLNAAWSRPASESAPPQWAVVASVDLQPGDNSARLDIVSPFAYQSLPISLEAPWYPKGVLDVPDVPWKVRFPSAAHRQPTNRLEVAVDETTRRNQETLNAKAAGTLAWHIVVALEPSPVNECWEYRSWQSGCGVMSLEKSQRFYVLQPSSWHMPLELVSKEQAETESRCAWRTTEGG